MSVVPYSKKTNCEVDRERARGNEEPFARRGFNLPQRPQQWIHNRREGETGVQTGATSADGKLVFRNEKRTLRNLMTKVAEHSIDRLTPDWMSSLKRHRSADNQRHHYDRPSRYYEPHYQRAANRSDLRDILGGRSVHVFSELWSLVFGLRSFLFALLVPGS